MTLSNEDIKEIQKLKQTAQLVCEKFFFDTFKITQKRIPNVVLAGGCFSSWLSDEVAKDFDIFLLDTMDPSTCQSINNMIDDLKVTDPDMVRDTPQEYIKQFQEKLYRVTTMDKKVQIIQTKYKTREKLIESFDVLHTCISYTPHDDKIYLSEAAFRAAKNKILLPNRNQKVQQWRIDKFVQRGFKNEIVSI